nr:MAG TPA: hypothetical protein [Caudoviricetes sp.]
METSEARAFLERFTKEELIDAILSKNDRGRTARSFCWSLYIDKHIYYCMNATPEDMDQWDELEKTAKELGVY